MSDGFHNMQDEFQMRDAVVWCLNLLSDSNGMVLLVVGILWFVNTSVTKLIILTAPAFLKSFRILTESRSLKETIEIHKYWIGICFCIWAEILFHSSLRRVIPAYDIVSTFWYIFLAANTQILTGTVDFIMNCLLPALNVDKKQIVDNLEFCLEDTSGRLANFLGYYASLVEPQKLVDAAREQLGVSVTEKHED